MMPFVSFSEYYVNITKENFELTILNRLSSENYCQLFLTLVELISSYLSITENPIISLQKITTLRLINLCPSIGIKSLGELKSIRRLIFDNCTIDFVASQQREDYDFYPRNLSRWIFDQGSTNTFNQFISMINELGQKTCVFMLSYQSL